MNLWILIFMLALPVVFIVALITRLIDSRTKKGARQKPMYADEKESSIDKKIEVTDNDWWTRLTYPQQQQLALSLAWKALPVWDKFTATHQPMYRTTATAPAHEIAPGLLKEILNQIDIQLQMHVTGTTAKINEYHHLFIEPVIALHDGVWVCPYPVKKLILAIFFILKSIAGASNIAERRELISKAINAALDCLELSKLYSREEAAQIKNLQNF